MKTATLGDYGFWDASGLVLLCLQQPETALARRLHAQAPKVVVWWGTHVEVRSAIRRAFHGMDRREIQTAWGVLDRLMAVSLEVEPTEELRELALDAVDRYDLRAADAFQLAAALIFCNRFPRGRRFVCFDKKLASAADLAGFSVLPRR